MPGFLFAQSWVESGMRWLLKRWWFWLIVAIVLALFCYVGYEIHESGRPLRERDPHTAPTTLWP
jgi:hypothetical protein